MSKIRWALIGTGRIAEAYGAVFATVPNAELKAVADVRPEAAAAFAAKYSCEAYGSHADLLRDAKIDAVLICTPPSTHEAIAVDCMERGLHVLCEKPLTLSSESAERMAQTAGYNGVVFTMASKFRHVPDIVRARELIAEGAIGDLILFENAFTARVSMSGRWNADPEIGGGGVLIDNGTHSVDIMRFFLGPIGMLQVVAGRHVQDLPVEDTVHLFARSKEGVMGNVDLSWSIDKQLESYVRLYGSEGMISVGWRSSYVQRHGGDKVVFGNGYDKNEAFRTQIESVSDACLGKGEPRVSLEDALASVSVIETAYTALHACSWMPVDIVKKKRIA